MINWIVRLKNFYRARATQSNRNRRLWDSAISEFNRKYPERKVLTDWGQVAIGFDGSYIITICYDWGGIPPRRSWWRTIDENLEPEELKAGEVGKYIEVPIWR